MTVKTLDFDEIVLGDLASHSDWIIISAPEEGVFHTYGTFDSWSQGEAHAVCSLNLASRTYAIVPLEKVTPHGVGQIIWYLETDTKSVGAVGIWPTFPMLAEWVTQNKEVLRGYSDFTVNTLEIVTR